MVARMYWNGEGTGIDRALDYAWMDVVRAGSRGADRCACARQGRVRRILGRRCQAAHECGPGTGAAAGDRFTAGGEFSGIALPASAVYDKAWWSPDEYWCTQDACWARPLNPNVDVGLPESVAPGGVK